MVPAGEVLGVDGLSAQFVFPGGPGGVCHPLNTNGFSIHHPACAELYKSDHRTWAIFDGWELEVQAHARLAQQGWNCTSVQECATASLFLSLATMIAPGYNHHFPTRNDPYRQRLFDRMVASAKKDQVRVVRRLLRKYLPDLKTTHTELQVDASEAASGKRRPTAPSSVTLGLHADPKSTTGPWRGQIKLWEAYSAEHGLRFLLDSETYFDGEVFGTWAGLFWAAESAERKGFWKKYEYLTPGVHEEVPSASWSWAQVRGNDLLSSLAIFNQPPIFWDSLEALAVTLPQNEWTVWIDFDLTISPCCFDEFSFVELIDGWDASMDKDARPHVIIRDSPKEDYSHHCANAGFVVVRNSPIGRLFLELARRKRQWPVVPYGYQGALAESLLELLGIEHAVSSGERTDSTYRSGCLQHLLFGTPTGALSYANFCQCWKKELKRLAGPEEARTSQWVRFVDPREGPETGLLLASLFLFRAGPSGGGEWLPPEHQVRGFGYLPLLAWGRDKHRSYVDAWLPPEIELGGPCGLMPLITHWASLPHRPKLIYEFLHQRFARELPIGLLMNGSVGEIAAAYKAAARAGREAWRAAQKIGFPQNFIAKSPSFNATRWQHSGCNINTARMWQLGGFTQRGRSTSPQGPHPRPHPRSGIT